MIRDYKTTGNLRNFAYELSGKFGYEISMAFYFALVKISTGIECDVLLDVVQSSGVYQSEVFAYTKEKMNFVLSDVIIPALNKFCEINDKWIATGDPGVWKTDKPFNRFDLFDLAAYPLLETGKQVEVTYI